MAAVRHEVAVPLSAPSADVLHLARCLCGWSRGFTLGGLRGIRAAAHAHVADHLDDPSAVVESWQ